MPRTRIRASCATATAAATALVLCGTLTGCGGGAAASASGTEGSGGGGGGAVTLRFAWWGNADRAALTEKAVAAFESAHPRVDIQTSYAPYESYKQKLATQAAGGDAPDVMQLDYRQISQYAGSGVLRDLSSEREVLPTGGIPPDLLRSGQVRDVQYALPMGVGTQAMAYDAKAWREAGIPEPEPGWTWDDWESALRTLKQETGTYGMTDPGQSEDWFEVWLRSRGKQLYDENGQAAFTAEDLARFWSYTSKLRKEGLVSPAKGTTQMDGSVENSPMGRGKAVAEFNWDAPSAGFEAKLGKNLALAPMPVADDGTPGQYFKPSMLVGVSANSDHPREAAQFIDFLLNSPEGTDILGVDRGLPVNAKQRARVVPRLTGFQKEVAGLQKSVEDALKEPPSAPPRGDNALQSTFQRDYDHVAFDKSTPLRMARQYLTEARAELRP